jgi:hypothetical protein
MKLADRNKTTPAANHSSQQASNCSQDKKHNFHYSLEKKSSTTISEAIFEDLCYTQKLHQQAPRSPLDAHGDAREYEYSSFGTSALPHQHRALRLLISRSH